MSRTGSGSLLVYKVQDAGFREFAFRGWDSGCKMGTGHC